MLDLISLVISEFFSWVPDDLYGILLLLADIAGFFILVVPSWRKLRGFLKGDGDV